MKEFEIGQEQAGKRLDKWLMKECPLLPMPLAQKYIRLKRIKINGKGADRDARLDEGDKVQLYIGDEFFEKPKKTDALLSSFRWHLRIVHEDEQILLVDKRPGLIVHPDAEEKVNTLVTHVRAYLYQKGEYDSLDQRAFSPVPCNRIDRFTGGIVMFAKTNEAMHALNQKIRDREIGKYYLCIVQGTMTPPEGMLNGYIYKEPGRVRVSVVEKSVPGAQLAQTKYKTLGEKDEVSLLECELLTGRTHQIRAQCAAAGHPLLGDNQYGDRKLNQRYRVDQQALYAYKLTFDFQSDAGVLNSLAGMTFMVKEVPFVETAYYRN